MPAGVRMSHQQLALAASLIDLAEGRTDPRQAASGKRQAASGKRQAASIQPPACHLVDKVAALLASAEAADLIEAGRRVLDAWFGGDLARFEAEWRQHAAYRALVDGRRFACTPRKVRRAVLIAALAARLGPKLSGALTATQFDALLMLADPAAQRSLAQANADQRWSLRRFQGEVQAARAERPQPRTPLGRPAKDAVRAACDLVLCNLDQLQAAADARGAAAEAAFPGSSRGLATVRAELGLVIAAFQEWVSSNAMLQ